MRQRVNLALALALEPKFVLLDEPTTGLDVVVQHSILENVRRLQAEQGFAVLFISHDIGTVLDLSDRILVMYAGRIVEEQPAGALLRDAAAPLHQGTARLVRRPARRDRPASPTSRAGRRTSACRMVGCSFAPRCPERIDPVPRRRPAARAARRRAGRLPRRRSCSARTGGAAEARRAEARLRRTAVRQDRRGVDAARCAATWCSAVEDVSKVFDPPPWVHGARAPRPSATSASCCARARSPPWSARAAAASRRSPG